MSNLDFDKVFDARGVVALDEDDDQIEVADSAVCDPEDAIEVTDLLLAGRAHTRVVLSNPETEGPCAGEPLFYMFLVDDGLDEDGELQPTLLGEVEFHDGADPADPVAVRGVMDGDLLAILISRQEWRLAEAKAAKSDAEAAVVRGVLRKLRKAAKVLCVPRG